MIYPIEIRDLLFWFAHFELFTPKWSKRIFDEWEEVMAKKGISEQEAKRRSNIANQAFPDALVTNYESLISTIDLPDEKDRHVLAAAIKVNANIIVTNNLKDFQRTTWRHSAYRQGLPMISLLILLILRNGVMQISELYRCHNIRNLL